MLKFKLAHLSAKTDIHLVAQAAEWGPKRQKFRLTTQHDVFEGLIGRENRFSPEMQSKWTEKMRKVSSSSCASFLSSPAHTALCTHLPHLSDGGAFGLFVQFIFEFSTSYPNRQSHAAKKLASHIALPPLLAAGLPVLFPNASAVAVVVVIRPTDSFRLKVLQLPASRVELLLLLLLPEVNMGEGRRGELHSTRGIRGA